MARLHLKFRNIDARVVRALTQTIEARPWRRHTNEAKRRVAQELADRIVDSYRVPHALSVRLGDEFTLDFNPGSTSYLYVRRGGWDTLSLLSGIRLFVQTSKHHEAGTEDPVDADLVFAWACSALYIVAPTIFRSLVRAGKVDGMSAVDTYTSETWAKIVEAGLVNDEGELTVSPERVANFLLTGEVQVDDEGPNRIVVQDVDSLFTAEDDEEGFDPEDDDYDEESDEETVERMDEDDYDPSADVEDEDDEDVAPEAPNTTGRFTGSSDGLEELGIVKLRKLSRGRISGGYSIPRGTLIDRLRELNVTASILDES